MNNPIRIVLRRKLATAFVTAAALAGGRNGQPAVAAELRPHGGRGGVRAVPDATGAGTAQRHRGGDLDRKLTGEELV